MTDEESRAARSNRDEPTEEDDAPAKDTQNDSSRRGFFKLLGATVGAGAAAAAGLIGTSSDGRADKAKNKAKRTKQTPESHTGANPTHDDRVAPDIDDEAFDEWAEQRLADSPYDTELGKEMSRDAIRMTRGEMSQAEFDEKYQDAIANEFGV